MMSFLLAVTAAATMTAAAPADPQASGFNAGAMAAFAGKQAVKTPDVGLLTSALRQCLANDPAACMERMRDNDRAALFAAIGPMDEASAPLVAYLAKSALVISGNNNVSGLYNPVADAWLVLRWDYKASGVEIGAAALVDGATLRGDTARWWEAEGSYGDALGKTWTASQAAFTAQFGRGVTPRDLTPSATLVAQRLTALTYATKAVRSDATLMTALETGRSALILGHDPKADNLQVASLPASVKQSTQLTTVIRRTDGVSGVFVSPLRPDLLLVVNLDAANHIQNLTPIAFTEVHP